MARSKPANGKSSSRVVELRVELARRIASSTSVEGLEDTAVPGLNLYRRSMPTACLSSTYEPSLIVFLQGKKLIHLGRATLVCDSSSFLLTSVELPVISQVIQATPQAPILGLRLKLEMAEVRKILSREELPISPETASGHAMAVGVTTVELLNACSRLLDLLAMPEDIPFLAGLIQREILYRLLRSPQGPHLRAIATLGEQCHRAAKAVTWLRQNFDKPIRIEDLASVAQMGVSTFHHHFRSLTAMSPLQYQKQLRLHAARERMLAGNLDAASAAFEVGYESASQFNREYSRMFGQPPMRDIKAHRLVGLVAASD